MAALGVLCSKDSPCTVCVEWTDVQWRLLEVASSRATSKWARHSEVARHILHLQCDPALSPVLGLALYHHIRVEWVGPGPPMTVTFRSSTLLGVSCLPRPCTIWNIRVLGGPVVQCQPECRCQPGPGHPGSFLHCVLALKAGHGGGLSSFTISSGSVGQD